MSIPNETSNMNYEPTRTATVVAGILMVIFLIPGILGNIWLIILLLRTRVLRQNIINQFIASLCVNDLINLTMVQSLVTSSYVVHGWPGSLFLCSIVPELNMLLIGVSLWHHSLIALHRYLVVVHWIFYRGMNKQRYKILVIIGTRVAPVLISLSFMINTIMKNSEINTLKNATFTEIIHDSFVTITEISPSQLRCIYKRSEKLRMITILIILLTVPCVIVFFCFTLVFIHVRKHALLQRKHNKNSVIKSNLNNGKDGAENNPEPQQKLLQTYQETEIEGSHSSKINGLMQRRESNPKTISNNTEKSDKKRIARELSITAMFGVVFLMFLIGYTPYSLTRMLDSARRVSADTYVILSVLYGAASCVNPIIFGLMNRELRKESEKLICKFCK